jgi:hypothetical protein
MLFRVPNRPFGKLKTGSQLPDLKVNQFFRYAIIIAYYLFPGHISAIRVMMFWLSKY